MNLITNMYMFICRRPKVRPNVKLNHWESINCYTINHHIISYVSLLLTAAARMPNGLNFYLFFMESLVFCPLAVLVYL